MNPWIPEASSGATARSVKSKTKEPRAGDEGKSSGKKTVLFWAIITSTMQV